MAPTICSSGPLSFCWDTRNKEYENISISKGRGRFSSLRSCTFYMCTVIIIIEINVNVVFIQEVKMHVTYEFS